MIRPNSLVPDSVNHRLPSELSATMPKGRWPQHEPSEYSVITPAVVIRPILPEPSSVNHRLPSGPAVIPQGNADAVGTVNSVIEPPVVIRAIRSPDDSVTQRLPSEPVVMLTGRLPALKE